MISYIIYLQTNKSKMPWWWDDIANIHIKKGRTIKFDAGGSEKQNFFFLGQISVSLFNTKIQNLFTVNSQEQEQCKFVSSRVQAKTYSVVYRASGTSYLLINTCICIYIYILV